MKERSGIDPDFWERSLTKPFVPAKALSFFLGLKKFRSQQFVYKMAVIPRYPCGKC